MDEKDAAQVRELLPDVLYATLDSGHLVHVERSEDYLRLVLDFAG